MWNQLLSWENLWLAYRKAAKGKRGLPPASRFEHQIADHLITLQDLLSNGRYRPGGYTHFYIQEPKRRKISAAPFRDRVIHHALCNVIEPLFEAQFIFGSFANRVGKGTHAAVDYLQQQSQSYCYVLRMDIVKHFPSLDHAILRDELAKVVQDEQVQWLIDLIIASGVGVLAEEYPLHYFPGDDLFAALRPRGLPIGNLTSQFWSNCYMNPLDHFVLEALRCPAYLRYVDDFALFSNSKRELWAYKQAIEGQLAAMRLVSHLEAQVQPVTEGIPWLGWVVWPKKRRLKRRNAVNFRRRLEHNIDLYEAGQITFAELDASVKGWVNHVRYGDTWGLRQDIFESHPIHPPPYRPKR